MSLTHVSYLWANSDQATMSLSNGSGILETHGHLMWDDHYDSIIAPLPAAYPHHPGGSVVDLEHHHIYSIIFDSLVDRFNMRHVTYVNCIFLTAIYGPSHGPRTPRVQGGRGPDQGSYFPPPHLHGDHPAAWITNQPTTHVVVPCHHGEKAHFSPISTFGISRMKKKLKPKGSPKGSQSVESEVEEEEEEKEEAEVPTNFDRSISDDMIVCSSEKTVSNHSNSEFWIEME
ncbi:hypothetical protein CEP52_015593 [Fusarium oligoseptatum]|uniref:Uncharacterized protein n=2 Tax=Fusarium solani species complex TaxID=232080 RepID=A0A428SBX7_9HYPO|nr:hypothetical protein CEP51_006848 [Fusarium floridanum]RSL87254.1 hypothetical protein CEP52_015593 [Fusarium oligoseptatum]